MNLYVPTPAAKNLVITHEMWVAFLCDPVLAAEIIFGIKLDAFQCCRLRYYWWCMQVIDSSGVGSGKTVVDFIFLCLRCILIPKQQAAIFYPSFGTGKSSFWEYFGNFILSGRAPVFAAQLGNPLKTEPGEEIAGDGTLHGPECYTAFFRNGNKLKMPAPSIALNSVRAASLTVNTLIIEEWPQIDASSDAIDKQLIDRARGENWNQYHPLWGNHIVYTGHAQTMLHPAAPRFQSHQRKVDAGDPAFANLSYSYKDFSDRLCYSGKTFKDQFRIQSTIDAKRAVCNQAEWLGQGFGIWGRSGLGWFNEQALAGCVEAGKRFGLLPVSSRSMYEELCRARDQALQTSVKNS